MSSGTRAMKSVISSKGSGMRLVNTVWMWTLAAGLIMPMSNGLTATASAQTSAQRVIQGKVFGPSGEPQAGAVVYLKDEKSLEIKTYISTAEGVYRFGQLGSQDDFSLWAEFGGHKSKNKNISAFDSKKTFDISLHIEDK